MNDSFTYIQSVARKFKIAQIMRAADSWCALSGQIIHKSAATRRQIIRLGALLHVCAIFHARRVGRRGFRGDTQLLLQLKLILPCRRVSVALFLRINQNVSQTNIGATKFATFAAEAAN